MPCPGRTASWIPRGPSVGLRGRDAAATLNRICAAEIDVEVGRSVALALIDNAAGVDRAFLEIGRFEVDLAGDRFAVTAHPVPVYDPKGLRVKA